MVICAGGYDLLVELVCTDDEHLLDLLNDKIRTVDGRHRDGDLHVPEAGQTDLRVGNPMTQDLAAGRPRPPLDALHPAVRVHRTGAAEVPVIVRGSGPYIYDQHGKRYLDGLSGLFVVQAGHGRTELAEAAAKQAAELAYFPLWSYAHPTAVELAERLAALDPGRPQPGLLHHRRLGGGGERLEAGPQLLQAASASR